MAPASRKTPLVVAAAPIRVPQRGNEHRNFNIHLAMVLRQLCAGPIASKFDRL